jgi:hypothetical protein
MSMDTLSVSPGGAHTCYIDSTHSTHCVGANDAGQLGVPASPASLAPVTVTGL